MARQVILPLDREALAVPDLRPVHSQAVQWAAGASARVFPELRRLAGELDYSDLETNDTLGLTHLAEPIAERIRRKIGWPSERAKKPALPFLKAFYTAQRCRLEQRLLLGERREHKRESTAGE